MTPAVPASRVTAHPAHTSDNTWGVEALGVFLRVEVDDDRLAARLRSALAPLTVRGGRAHVAEAVTVTGAGPWAVRSPAFAEDCQTPARALSAALAAVNLTAVDLTPHLCIHAAVVERDGVLLAIPAASGTGKTTLATALLQRGWQYLSDESLALRWGDGSLVTYPRALALSPWTCERVGLRPQDGEQGSEEYVYLPHQLGAEIVLDLDADKRVDHVVVPLRAPGGPALRPLHRADALGELLRRGFTVHQDPRRALDLLAALVRAAETWTVLLGDPQETARLVDDHLRGRTG